MKTLRKVKVEFHQDGASWRAESPDVPGWTAVGDSRAEVGQLAREGLPFFLNEEVLVDDGSAAFAETASAWVNTASSKVVPIFRNERGSLARPFPRVRDTQGRSLTEWGGMSVTEGHGKDRR